MGQIDMDLLLETERTLFMIMSIALQIRMTESCLEQELRPLM